MQHIRFSAMARVAQRLSLVGAAALGLSAWTASAQAVELIFNNYAPPTSATTRILFRHFAQQIEERTNGEITVTIPGTSMAPVDGLWELVTTGVADVVNHPRYITPQQLHLAGLAELPFNTLSSEAASVALQRTYERYFADRNEYEGVKVLALNAFAGRQIMNNIRPIEAIEDYAGIKIWATPGPLADAVRATGATPVVAPFPQLFEFASRGTIDGAILTPETAAGSQVASYMRYYTVVPGGLGNLSFGLMMNIDTWNSLSPEHQQIIEEIASTLPAEFGRTLDEDEERALEGLDLEIIEASPELVAELQERLSAQEEAWIAGARERGIDNPEEILSYYREEMEAVIAERSR